MKLQRLKYSQFEGTPRAWLVDGLDFEETNLLVGKNASGKSKILNVIRNFSRILSGELQPTFKSGSYDAFFDFDGKPLRYFLSYKDSMVVEERFEISGKELLSRGAGGIGKLWAEKINDYIEFQTPEQQTAALSRRDSIQHPFFEVLFEWGNSVFYYPFGTPLGKDRFAIFNKEATSKPEPKNAEEVIGIFRQAEKKLGDGFLKTVCDGMRAIGYPISKVGLTTPVSVNVKIDGVAANDVLCLFVQEDGLTAITDQNEMSQGMFRALSIIIQISYAEMTAHPSCILIDDIGEGLDFDRSSALIEQLVHRANQSRIQLIMTTNDRFVMNKVPLNTWTVLQRNGSQVRVYNYKNSKALFDQFEITGLNNFDFFSMNFVKESVK